MDDEKRGRGRPPQEDGKSDRQRRMCYWNPALWRQIVVEAARRECSFADVYNEAVEEWFKSVAEGLKQND